MMKIPKREYTAKFKELAASLCVPDGPKHHAPGKDRVPSLISKPRCSMTYRALLLVVLFSSIACAQVPPNDAAPLRVIIRFQQATPGEAPDVLARLAEVSGVGVRHAAAVSDREYAYLLTCPAADPGCTRAMAALRNWTRIEQIDPDTVKQIKH